MKAAVLREVNQPLAIEDVSVPKPGPREVLIRTRAVGVCHSDLHFVEGLYPYPLPAVLGHEAAGVVEQVGSAVTYVKPGDHVITCLSAFCGHCEPCLTGHMSLCKRAATSRRPVRRLASAARAESVPRTLVVRREDAGARARGREDPPRYAADRAALIGCGVTTGVGAVIHTAKVEPGETVAVIGCGGIGLAAVNGAAIAGAGRIIAIDSVPGKLELARQLRRHRRDQRNNTPTS